MDTPAAGRLVSASSDGFGGAAVPGVPSGPGWLVLRDCPLGGNGPPVGLALLHPKIGVALVDLAPRPSDAAGRFRRALDDRRFPAIFGGYPPVVQVVLPADRLPELGQVLSARFKAETPLALEGGDAWLPTARSALEEAPAAAPLPLAGPAARRDVAPWRAAALVLGAAAAGAAAAAIAVAPPWRAPRDTPPAAVAAAPWPAASPQPWPAPERTTAATAPEPSTLPPAPAAASPRPEPAEDTGADVAFAAAPQEAGGGRPPPGEDQLAQPQQPALGEDRLALLPPLLAPDEDRLAPLPPLLAPGEDRLAPLPPLLAPDGDQSPVPSGGRPVLFLPPPPEPPAPDAAGAADDRPWPVPPVPPQAPDRTGAAEGLPTPPMRPGDAPPPRAKHRTPAPDAAGAPASAAETAGRKRCHDILVKATLGEGLSDGDKQLMLRGCKRPRS